MWPFNIIFLDTMFDNVSSVVFDNESSVVECLTRDREVAGLSLTGGTVLCH